MQGEKKKRVYKPYYILVEECCEEKNPNVWDIRTCPICGKKFYVRKRYKRVVCSVECQEKYRELYYDEINKRRSESCRKTYNSKSKEEITKEHEKAKQTCLKRYGYERAQQTPEYRKKLSKRFKEKDWSERTRKNNELLISKYKKICEKDDLELIEFRNRFDCTVKCKKCGNIFNVHILGYLTQSTNTNLCRKCHPNKNTLKETKPQKIITDFLDEINVIYEKNKRDIIPPYEIDVYIPESKIGIEINGNFWHSEIGGGRNRNYHIVKTFEANKQGVKLIQIFEDEILLKEEIVKSNLKSLLQKTETKIYAKNCTLSEISYADKHTFLEKNHIDGDTKSTYNYGLLYEGNIVSVLTVCNRKINGKECMEITRFTNKLNTNIVGGFSKLLKYFLNEVKPHELVTYVDIRWSGADPNDTIYYKYGFTHIETTKPSYFYVERNNYLIRLNRLNFTKNKLVCRGFNPEKTETEIMFENNYDRLWNCGSMKFKLVTPQGVSFDSLE